MWEFIPRLPDRLKVALKQFSKRVRRRILWTLIAFGIGGIATWYYREDVFMWLLAPADGRLSPFEGGPPVFTAPTDMLGSTFKLAIWGGALTAFPVLVISTYTLFGPLMPRQSRTFVYIFIPATLAFFLGGVTFVYYVMLPVSLGFLLKFGGNIAVPLITLREYMDLLLALMFWVGVVFELPLVMFLLAKLRILSYRRMKWLRKFVPVTAFILAAIITPTFDIMNQMMVAVPIILLYEVGMFLAWLSHPEEGDYLFMKSLWHGLSWVARRPVVALRKIRAGVRKVFRV